jgi:ABC-type nitrate/sulfonate/bicarbonate transport system substrate-binding protein
MPMRRQLPDLTRRKLAFSAAGMLAPGFLAAWNPAEAAAPIVHAARFAPVPRTTEHCLPWIAAEAGIFAALGVATVFPEADSTASDELASLAEDKWDFAFAGIAQVAQKVLQGADPVLILTPLQSNKGGFLTTRREIRAPEQLAGARVGVLSESGPSALAARAVLERWSASATLVSLQSFAAVYTALAEERIDAGWLPFDMSFRGQKAFNWNAFQGVHLGIPGGFVTTRRTVASMPGLVAAVAKGLVNAIHFFKSEPIAAVSLLQRWLRIEDRALAEDLHAFYAPIFRTLPTPSVFFGMQGLRDSLKARYPAAANMQPSHLVDTSFVAEMERSGYIGRLYSSLRNQ